MRSRQSLYMAEQAGSRVCILHHSICLCGRQRGMLEPARAERHSLALLHPPPTASLATPALQQLAAPQQDKMLAFPSNPYVEILTPQWDSKRKWDLGEEIRL